MANYTKYSIRCCNEEQADILTAYLADYPFESFEFEDGLLNAYIPTNENLTLHTDIEDILSDADYTSEEIENENWNAAWESDFEEVDIDGKVLIRAPFHTPRPDYSGLEVVIQPKMSFGTGHHATTRMMVEMVLRSNVAGRKVLDMGSGTGVLAIVAAKLGAASVMAVEIDDMAEESIRENIVTNGVDKHIESICSDVRAIEGREFDIILANINRNILLNDMAAYVATLNRGGNLVISGFLAEDVDILTNYAASLGLTPTIHLTHQEWQAISFIYNI